MKRVTKKHIRFMVNKSLDGILEALNIQDRSKKSKKVLKKFSKELSRYLREEVKGVTKRKKSGTKKRLKRLKNSTRVVVN